MPMSEVAIKLGGLLLERKLFIASAESLTCGNIQTLLGSISGSSNYFSGGITAYQLEDKVRLLRVNERHARETNAVSERVAAEMARGACELFNCDIGIGTTGYAEAAPENLINEPFAYFAIWGQRTVLKEGLTESGIVYGGNASRIEVQILVSEYVLSKTLGWLERTKGSGDHRK